MSICESVCLSVCDTSVWHSISKTNADNFMNFDILLHYNINRGWLCFGVYRTIIGVSVWVGELLYDVSYDFYSICISRCNARNFMKQHIRLDYNINRCLMGFYHPPVGAVLHGTNAWNFIKIYVLVDLNINK